MNEAEIVFAAVASGQWKVTKNPPSAYMTDEGNRRSAWTVERAEAPYCADLGPGKGWGNRHWNAPTALEALRAAAKEMNIYLPEPETINDQERARCLAAVHKALADWPQVPSESTKRFAAMVIANIEGKS